MSVYSYTTLDDAMATGYTVANGITDTVLIVGTYSPRRALIGCASPTTGTPAREPRFCKRAEEGDPQPRVHPRIRWLGRDH
jgi:hypothetical protein